MSNFPPHHPPSTRSAVLKAARNFAPAMGADYAHLRNHVVPGHPHVSKLVAALRLRLITEDELVQIALDEHGAPWRCQKFLQEVYWRSYWRSWLAIRPGVWTSYLETREEAKNAVDAEKRRRIASLEDGESGVAPMDAFARELVGTGYMHNHARMWFAAFWIHTEQLPWQLGADFFERHLICACPAANTLSWRWVAGLHTHGKTYLTRRSNLEKYCDSFYLGNGEGMEHLEHPQALHLTEAASVTAIQTSPRSTQLPATTGATGLWISEDDLSPETSVLEDIEAQSVAVTLVGAAEKSAVSNGLRRAYRTEATADAAARAKDYWKAPTEILDVQNAIELGQKMVDWARRCDLKSIVALEPAIGPTSDTLPVVRGVLHDADVELHLVNRAEDVRRLSYANAGFFRFWSAIMKESKKTGNEK